MAGGQFNHLPKVPALLTAQVARIVERTAFAVEARAKVNVIDQDAIDTGNMLGSIAAVPAAPLSWQVVVVPPYSLYVEMGTRYMAARPFLGPALAYEARRLQAARIVVRLRP